MKKIILSLLLVSLLACMLPCTASAETLKIVVDTEPVTYTDAVPFIENGRTMIPLRLVSENMQAEVEYDEKTSTITITKSSECVTASTTGYPDRWNYIEYLGKRYENSVAVAVFQKDSPQVKIELHQGDEVIHSSVCTMDAAAKIIDGRTYVPARYVAYALGYGIYYDAPRNRVLYQYKAVQIADFEHAAKYPYDYYAYNEILHAGREAVYNYRAFPYRQGFGQIMVVNGDNGWYTYTNLDRTERGHEMSYLTFMPVFCTFETQEYKFLPTNTPKENFEIFETMYEDKVGENATVSEADGVLRLDIDAFTYDAISSIQYTDGLYIIGPDRPKLVSDSSLSRSRNFSRYDYSNHYYTDNGEKRYMTEWKGSTADSTASRYNLLLLETFLGDMGERIWSMMDDYFMHKGPFDRGEVWIGEGLGSHVGFLDTEIAKEHCTYYGIEYVENINTSLTDDMTEMEKIIYQLYQYGESYFVGEYNGVQFVVKYNRAALRQPQCGYEVYVEDIQY